MPNQHMRKLPFLAATFIALLLIGTACKKTITEKDPLAIEEVRSGIISSDPYMNR
jgi:hypothetical protein